MRREDAEQMAIDAVHRIARGEATAVTFARRSDHAVFQKKFEEEMKKMLTHTPRRSARVSWPTCPEHGLKLVFHAKIRVGSPWCCPECGAISTEEKS